MEDRSKGIEDAGPQRSRAEELFERHRQSICARTDRLFASLMLLQWLGAVVLACWISPRTWAGPQSSVHMHVWLAIFFGGAITLYPALLAVTRTGRAYTRHVIAAAQMLMSALLIHISGGRVETHFHVFGSLAFLAFYRDWRVFIPATIVVGLDHFLRGVYWPQSVYGVLAASPWRAVEHTAWVVFEDIFLTIAIRQSLSEMWDIATQRSALEFANQRVERTVFERTQKLQQTLTELARSNEELTLFASVVSHELQEPLRKILTFGGLLETLAAGPQHEAARYAQRMQDSAKHMKSLVESILNLHRAAVDHEPLEKVDLNKVLQEVAADFKNRLEAAQGSLEIGPLPVLDADEIQMRRLFTNLVSNAYKFRNEGRPPRINVSCSAVGKGFVQITVSDNGIGLEERYLLRIFKPFQRLHRKSAYEGSGIGLAICERILRRHGGVIAASSQPGQGAAFTLTLPAQESAEPLLAEVP